MLSLAERYEHDGIVKGVAIGEARGEARGKVQGASKIIELIKSGLSPDDALRKLKEDENWLNELQFDD